MKNFITFLIIGFIFLPGAVFGFSVSQITNHQVAASFIYQQQFDMLVLDAIIPSGKSGESDILKAIAIQNNGTAHNITEISKMILWQDSGKSGFQGMGIDTKIEEFNFYYDNSSWYLDNLNISVPADGLRIFVGIETAREPTSNTTLQFKIPALQDAGQNGIYNLGDFGIFMESKNNGPVDDLVINQYSQTIRRFIADELAPKVNIANLSDAAVLTTTTYKISGMARDQGGSYPKEVKIGINDVWHDVVSTADNYYTWEYNWKNIAEGTYVIKTKSIDGFDNTGISDGIQVAVQKKLEETATTTEITAPPVEETTTPTTTAPVEKPVEKPIIKMTADELKAKIKEIEELLTQLLQQLIKLLQEQILQTRAKLKI